MSYMVRIVIIDDNPGSLELLTMALSRDGLVINTASNPREGLALVRDLHPKLVITDLVMPGMTGLEVLRRIVEFDPTIDVILMTAHYTTETAVASIRDGAADYLEKPINISRLRERVRDLLDAAEKRRSLQGHAADDLELTFEGLQARSAVMWELFRMVDKVAPHYRTLLLHGPTGAGKDLVARALHHRSGVKGKYVVLNCSAVVETLFESELFGHVRGAFTGADRDKTGLFALANGGTLFLDEIGDMPISTQAKLLRAVQNQEVMPVGSMTPVRVNVRIVAATHHDLRALVAQGRFREDLYYRLSMVELDIPPLKERRDDINLLARYFIQKFSEEFGKAIHGISRKAEIVLERYGWPGNVRELEHVIGRACMLADGPTIEVEHLPANLMQAMRVIEDESPAMPSSLHDQELALLKRTLRETAGNQSETARRLGIGRDALRYKMRKYRLQSVGPDAGD